MQPQSTLMLALLQSGMLATASVPSNNIFHGNCRRLELITEPRLTLAGWCPVVFHEAMQSEWAYSTIHLDHCLSIPSTVDDDEHLSAEPFEKDGTSQLAAPQQNLTTACDTSTFKLDGSVLTGACGDAKLHVDLGSHSNDETESPASPYFRYSHTGRMYCGSHKGPFPEFGAFHRTCSHIKVENSTGRPVLQALCQSHPFESNDESALNDNDPVEVHTQVDVMDCLAQSFWRTGPYDIIRNGKSFAARTCPYVSYDAASTNLTIKCEPDGVTEENEWTLTLKTKVRNKDGHLACYGLVGDEEEPLPQASTPEGKIYYIVPGEEKTATTLSSTVSPVGTPTHWSIVAATTNTGLHAPTSTPMLGGHQHYWQILNPQEDEGHDDEESDDEEF